MQQADPVDSPAVAGEVAGDDGNQMVDVNDEATNKSKNVYKCPKTTKVADQNQTNWRIRNADESSGATKRSTDQSRYSKQTKRRGGSDNRETFDTSYRGYNEQRSNYNHLHHDWSKVRRKYPNAADKSSTAAEFKFSFVYLNDLSEKDSNEVISALATKKTDFEQFLLDVPSELMAGTIRVLGKVCRANFEETVTSILVPALSSKFLEKLDDYLLRLPYEKETEKRRNIHYHDDVGRFWTDLTDFFKKVIELLPSKACDGLKPILEKIGIIFEFVEKFQKDCRIDEKIKQKALTLHQVLEAEVKRIEEKTKAVRKPIVSAEPEEENPPDDFRDLSIIPTFEDMINDKPFIRKCKINEPYSSADHYLDVQFRLLREDFVYPLRNGLREYLKPNPQKFRNSDLRIYRKVTILTPDVQDNTVGITVSFPVMNHINWRQTKRLIYGGLVLLSDDNFKTILFATIACRDEKELANGRILLEPCEGTEITREMYNRTYVMLESKIYFEPYWAILNAMKHLTEDNFPMREYLINANNTRRLPEYIRDVDSLHYKGRHLSLAYGKVWSDAKKLDMDETQLNAFRSALTQEFSLIQGPPGTGKTFIALEIVGTLLKNIEYWQDYGPIVVVCLTNHALDQFLEGVLKYTKNVVRVGSRSKNEALKPYTLMERRRVIHSYDSSWASSMMYNTKREMENILGNIQKTLLHINYLNLPDAIVPLDVLKENCKDVVLQDFESNQDLLSWLIEVDINPYSIISSWGVNLREQQIKEIEINCQKQLDNISEYEKYHKRSIMDDELECSHSFTTDRESKPIFPLAQINIIITHIQKQLAEYKNTRVNGYSPFDPVIMELNERFKILNDNKLFVQQELKHHSLVNPNCMVSDDPFWESYWYWVKDSYENAMNRLHQLKERYHKTRLTLKDAKQLVDLDTLKRHSIVGLTTTGAAKIYSSLRALHAPIVLVEEAAEILESHVVCSLTEDCQQVILIGDHKQLQPKASVYKLGKDYNLNISLFERMVRIMGDCTQLAYQHRMRPQFAKLITPAIYETLYNHKTVLDYPDVVGLEKNLFFLNHVQREENHDMDDSWTNHHEAEFLVAFARHLVLQGYSTDEITILCTYTGQLFTLIKEKGRYSSILQDLRVTTVDNFQGEENKIILLSLVRNNGEGNIGFLREENRVCVALSRAREGLYIMGNMDDLMVKNSIWPKIKSVLEEENAIGDVLQLRCQIHSDHLIQVKTANDFQQSPEGGCSKMCGVDMPCGHLCLSVCHMRDREHQEVSCRQPCLKACPLNHPCSLFCYEGCKPCEVKVDRELSCGHTVETFCSSDPKTFPCYIKVETTLPDCNHQIQKLCHLAVKLCTCTHPCDSRLPCGHTCKHTCHVTSDPEHIKYKCKKDCAKTYSGCENNHQCKKRCFEECGLCPITVEKTRSCGHVYKTAQCGVDLEKQPCTKPCKRDIPSCGHNCNQCCSDPCGNCQIMVEKESIKCGHKIKIKCSDEAKPSICSGKCPKTLPCGHPCTKKCKDQCTITCEVMVKLSGPGLCGHIFEVPCYLRNTDQKSKGLLKYCKEPCKVKLVCQHYCKGNCGECQQGRLHIFCSEPCGFPLVCGHVCDEPCREACKPCKRNCELQCKHSKCKKKCGMPCSPCIEPCALRCEHKKCKKRCSEMCNIEPCTIPCTKILKCDHPCVGFCGDPCPPLCRICNKDELTEFLFGEEDEPDARFVLLEDCNHCIESNGLSKWLELDNKTIKVKTCPKCKTPIKKSVRLMNQIKKDLNDVQLVKKKIFYGHYKDLQNIQKKRLEAVRDMLTHSTVADYPEIRTFLNNLRDRLRFVRKEKRQILSAQDIDSCRVVVDIMNHMIKILSSLEITIIQVDSSWFHRSTFSDYKSSYTYIESQISMILKSIPLTWQMPKQRIEDIELELLRLHYMAKVCNNDIKFERETILEGLLPTYSANYKAAIEKLTNIKRFEEKFESDVLNTIESLQLEQLAFKIERCMIVQAMGFKQGHWFKCPNGHPYVIGECGGAMEIAKCNECGAKIGGTNHRLLSNNLLAGELDGATNPAWPQ